MKLTPEQLRQNAAAMLAAAEGKQIQCSYHGSGWSVINGDPQWDFENCEYRPKPWSLPSPPAGKQWHRADGCTEAMLPVVGGKQTRLLLTDEIPQPPDEWQMSSGQWIKQGSGIDIGKHNFRHRTTRPLPSEPKVRPWSKPEDVPLNCWIRGSSKDGCCAMVIGLCSFGLTVSGTYNPPCGERIVRFQSWDELKGKEYSTDRRTWQKCEVQE